MEQIKRNYFGGANFEARTVKDIIAPAKSISNKVSVRAARKKQCLLLRRPHDCGGGANNAQRKARRSFVVTREKLLVGTINIEAIVQEKRWRKRLAPPKSRA